MQLKFDLYRFFVCFWTNTYENLSGLHFVHDSQTWEMFLFKKSILGGSRKHFTYSVIQAKSHTFIHFHISHISQWRYKMNNEMKSTTQLFSLFFFLFLLHSIAFILSFQIAIKLRYHFFIFRFSFPCLLVCFRWFVQTYFKWKIENAVFSFSSVLFQFLITRCILFNLIKVSQFKVKAFFTFLYFIQFKSIFLLFVKSNNFL